MASGRTPTLRMVGASQTVDLEDEQSAYPFPQTTIRRKYEERETRNGSSGARQMFRIFKRYTGDEAEMRFVVPYCSETNFAKLLAMVKNDVPTVAVTYQSETFNADFVEMTYQANDFDYADERYRWTVGITLLRESDSGA